MDDCIFCKIIAGQIPSARVYEDDTAIIFLDINQASKGHLLIVPRYHTADFHDLDSNTAAHMGRLALEWAGVAMQAVGSDGYNLILNNRKEAGQEVPHTHFHIIPRWGGDGYLKGPIPTRIADGAELQATAALIRGTK